MRLHRWREWGLACWVVLLVAVGITTAATATTTAAAPSAAEPAAATFADPTALALPTPPPANGRGLGGSPPIAVQAESVGLDASLVPVGLLPDGAMDVPPFGTAGWFAPASSPGEPGPAVLVGHLDSRTGPDVFAPLRSLVAGDEVAVPLADGSIVRFIVHTSETTAKDDLPVDRIFAPTLAPTLRLITCGGAFDRATGHYDANLIVYLVAAPPTG